MSFLSFVQFDEFITYHFPLDGINKAFEANVMSYQCHIIMSCHVLSIFVQVDEFITHHFPLDGINEAFEALHKGEAIRSMIHFCKS